MLDSFQIYEELSKTIGDEAAKSLTKTLTKIYDDLSNTVTKVEFNELKEVVSELAEAQKRTEQRLEELAEAQKRTEQRLEELAEAQKKTEQRLDELAEAQKKTEQRLEELAEAQKKTEQRLDELAEAQKKTEQRLEELAEAQKKTEQRLNELAEAQKKTEESLNRLIKRVDNIEDQLGGLSMAVGYGIEDKLYPHISKFAQKYFGVTVEDTVLRKNVIYPDGKFDEINLYISGKKDGKDVLVLGECKAQPGKKDIDKFIKMVSRLKDFFKKEIFTFVVGYTFNPVVEEYTLKKYPELKFFKTYEIEHEKY
jgi:DNA repair exonuclease SbcCD ATPase subunit